MRAALDRLREIIARQPPWRWAIVVLTALSLALAVRRSALHRRG